MIKEVKEIKTFKCGYCSNTYDNLIDALKCNNRGLDKKVVNVGDIVDVKHGVGWFDGDDRWVINPNVDMSKHGFSKDCSMGFYYVVTAIDHDGHRHRYHVATKAMTGRKGYREGYTYSTGHYTPKLIDPMNVTDYVIEDSKDLIGLKAQYLI